ncbi:MAG TPA: hypothetical protein VFR49_13065, partial [Solirubrobacteraceae bacterium]|nr:hypothetical protein [Solirubrobacteraceae bacterium]
PTRSGRHRPRTRTRPRLRRRPPALAAAAVTALAALLAAFAALAGSPAAGAAAGPTTTFTGRIVSGTGRYVHVRGTVRLVLRTSSRPLAFRLTLSAPSCAGGAVPAPQRCVALSGTIAGTAVSTRHNPDVGASFALAGHGRVAPLGAVSATGQTGSLGFIARGRFPLSLRLRTSAGSLAITAQGPLVKGFSSPF